MAHSFWRAVSSDLRSLSHAEHGRTDLASLLRTALSNDSFAILALTRARALGRDWHLPGVNHFLRQVQSVIYGIEIGKDVTLGSGVYFIHPLGVVIGGDATIGERVKFMGSNTVGTAKDNGYPKVENDVLLGCGSRVLGPVRVGEHSIIGANAVVLNHVPPGSVAIGAPARAKPRSPR